MYSRMELRDRLTNEDLVTKEVVDLFQESLRLAELCNVALLDALHQHIQVINGITVVLVSTQNRSCLNVEYT